MRFFAAFLIVLASVAAAAVAFPPASVEDADRDSITVSGLDCGTTYDITLSERGSGATHSLTQATDACPDGDGDGVPDSEDECPVEAGTAPNGCNPSQPPPPPPPMPSADNRDPLCTGYAQPRVYLENQSWWEPQNGPFSHPGTGRQGHIHIETCFPAYRHFNGTETLTFDLTIRLHDAPGQLMDITAQAYGDEAVRATVPKSQLQVRCPVADCVFERRVTLNLSQAQYSGLHTISFSARYLNEPGADGVRHPQLTLPAWPIYLDNGKPAPPAGSVLAGAVRDANHVGLTGDSLYPDSQEGDYAGVGIAEADVPWDSTLRFRPISGVWRPLVFFEKDTGFAYVDPALHANPRNTGKVVYEGVGFGWGTAGRNRLAVDTTQLSDGVHRLLVGTCNANIVAGSDRGDHCGTQVVRFLVDNP